MSAIGDRGIGYFRDYEWRKFESNFCERTLFSLMYFIPVTTLYLLSNNLRQVAVASRDNNNLTSVISRTFTFWINGNG